MSVRIVRLGTSRGPDEGIRIGTVRHPPRGVPKSQFSSRNWYDVWFPNLAPSLETMKLGLRAETPAQWNAYARKYRAEMAAPRAKRDLELLAALSHVTNFSVGCYCENEDHCHRSLLRKLLVANGAKVEKAALRNERRVTVDETPLYTSGSTVKSLWQEYFIYTDRVEFDTKFGKLKVPFDRIERIDVSESEVKGLLRGDLHLKNFRPALKLDWANFLEHVVLDQREGLFRRILFTPDDVHAFKRALDAALDAFRAKGAAGRI